MKVKTKTKFFASDAMNWTEANNLIQSLIKAKDYKFALLLGIGINTALRISDILKITYTDLKRDAFFINETKTNKLREITINPGLREIINICLPEQPYDLDKAIFCNAYGKTPSTQGINMKLHRLKKQYNLSVTNISSHSLRKTGARRIWETKGSDEAALILVSQILQHESIGVTRKYLGITRQDIASAFLGM